MITVSFFAALREQLNCDEIQLEITESITVEQARSLLVELHPQWEQHLANNSLLIAVNHDLVDEDFMVTANDELAFFPPVTGG